MTTSGDGDYLALRGTYIERMHAALKFAHDNRLKAFRYADFLRPDVERDLTQRSGEAGRQRAHVMPSAQEVSFALDRRLAGDPKFTGPVANERWGIRLANTYALVELLYAQRYTNFLLERLLGRSGGSTDPPPSQAPEPGPPAQA